MRCSICCLSSCFLWRFRRCHRHRPFHRALGRPCAAPPYKGHAVLPSLSSAFLCARRHRRNLESRRSLRRAGGCVLLCQPVCAGLCQHLWRHRHCRQHHRAEFRIFHLLLQPPPTSAKTMRPGNPCAAKNPTALPSAPSSCFAAPSAGCLLPIRLLFKAPASAFCVSCFFEPVCNLYEIPAAALRSAGHPLLPAAAMVIGPCTFRIAWSRPVFTAHPSLSTLYHAFPLSRLFLIVLSLFGVCPVRPFAASKAPQ